MLIFLLLLAVTVSSAVREVRDMSGPELLMVRYIWFGNSPILCQE